MQNSDRINMKGEVALGWGKKLSKQFDGWGEKYLVEFDIIVNRWVQPTQWLNVLRMTSTDNDCCNHGDRLPLVFVNGLKQIHIAASVGEAPNFSYDFYFELNKMYHIEIRQDYHQFSKFGIFCIKSNGATQVCQLNTSPRLFDGVKIYTSGSHEGSFANHGKLSNLLITKLPSSI